MAEVQYPSNSNKSKQSQQRPKVKKVTTGPVRIRERTASNSFIDTVWGRYVKPALIFAEIGRAHV